MSTICGESEYRPTYENQCSIEVVIVLLDVVGIILCRFLLVHSVEIEASVVVLYGLQEGPESILYAIWHSAISPGDVTDPAHHFGSISTLIGGGSISGVSSIVVE